MSSGYGPSTAQSQQSLPQAHTQMVRRSPPPRFRPCMIIIVVLSLGGLFIGLTLTIIAHWPGYTAIGYNPLKIVGPVILSLGGVVFIGCIVEVVRRNQSEKENYERQMQERERMMSFANRTMRSTPTAHSNPSMTMASGMPGAPMTSGPQGMHEPPSRGILKAPSSSTYGPGSQYGDRDSGVDAYGNQSAGNSTYNSAPNSAYTGGEYSNQNSAYNSSAYASTNMSYEPDSRSQQGSDPGGRYEVHAMPDPNMPAGAVPVEANIPQPVRTRSKDHKKKSTAYPQHQDNGQMGYGQDGQVGYGQNGQMGYGQSEQMGYGQSDIPNDGYSYGTDGTANAVAAEVYNYADVNPETLNYPPIPQEAPKDRSFDMYDDPLASDSGSQDREAKRRRREQKKKKKHQKQALQASGAPVTTGQPLNINISAQPGVQVTITPKGTPSMERHPTPETEM